MCKLALSGMPSPKFTATGRSQCSCIVHEVFSGVLQSKVICTSCNSTSSVYDPCFDISLDIVRPVSIKGSSNNSNGTIKAPPPLDTLVNCLVRFIQPEQLTEGWHCSHCTVSRVASKSLVFYNLPSVCCFHLKRFEHNRSHGYSRRKVRSNG